MEWDFCHSLIQYPGGCLNLTCEGMCTCDDKGKKWRAKNEVSVGFSTENPPWIHPLRVCARRGMAENRLGMDDCGLSKWCLEGGAGEGLLGYRVLCVSRSQRKILIQHADGCR